MIAIGFVFQLQKMPIESGMTNQNEKRDVYQYSRSTQHGWHACEPFMLSDIFQNYSSCSLHTLLFVV